MPTRTATSRNRPARVFVAHSFVDTPFAERFIAELRRHGIRPVFRNPALKTGVNREGYHANGVDVWSMIEQALKQAGWVLFILSRHSVDSKWVKRELA